MEEVKHRSGSRVKLKRVDEDVLPDGFVGRLREFSHNREEIQALFVFVLQAEGQPEQLSMAIAIKSGFFSKQDESFLEVVDELQLMLPENLALNLYRFGASEFLARYCAANLEPLYLRSATWLDKQRKKYAPDDGA